MVLDDVADYLSTGGMGDVYKDYSPPTPDTVTSIHSTIGSAPTFTMGGPHIMEQPRVQVVCRSLDLQEAHTNAKTAYGLLNGARNQVINGVLYDWITALYEPILIGRDQNARFLVACNYDITKQRST